MGLLALAAAAVLSWLIWLRGFSDYLSVTFEEASVTGEGFQNLLESSNAEAFSSAAAWKEDGEMELETEQSGRSTRVMVYGVRGQVQAVFGNTLLAGRYFTEGEETVCLLDERAAKELFGSDDVTGREAVLMGETRKVTGILQGDRGICVIPAGEDEAFRGITVRKQRTEQSSANALTAISSYAQGETERIVDGQFCYILALLRTAGILTALTIIPAVLLIKVKEKRLAGAAVLAAGLLILAVFAFEIPLGSDYLPTYWSDFDFFGDLWEEKAQQIEGLREYQEFWHEEGFLESFSLIFPLHGSAGKR